MDIKFNCSNPACRSRFAVDESMAGRSLPCPACGTLLQVPGSLEIRFHCTNPECGQHIVVDVSEAGRSVRCPSCGKVSQIPGAPPKSCGLEPVAKAARPVEFAPVPRPESPSRRRLYACGMACVRLLCGWGIGAAIIFGFYYSAEPLRQHLNRMGNAILSHRILDVPLVNTASGVLYYAHAIWGGAEIYRLDLTTLKQQIIDRINNELGPRDFKWLGWSPDQHNAAYYVSRNDTHQELVVLHDYIVASSIRTFDISSIGKLDTGAWLTTNSLILVGLAEDRHALLNFQTDPGLGRYGKAGLVPVDSMPNTKSHWLVADSIHSIAYVESQGISTLDIASGKGARLISYPRHQIEGLRYSPDNGKYLFSAHVNESDKDAWRIFEYGPRESHNAKLTQLTEDCSTNAQWIQEGTGIAYAGRKGIWHDAPKKGQAHAGTNYLAVRAGNPGLSTNLFLRGTVRSYSVDAPGQKLYVHAAVRLGLASIWEYDINRKTLRDVLPPVKDFQFITPVEATCTNDEGKTVDYYYMPPAGMVPGKKYPVVLDNYLANSYELSGQFLANAGIFYVSADHFGITDWRAAPLYEQTMAVYRAILKNPNVDPHRIYISGTSRSTVVACQLAESHVDLWRGVILLSPVTLPAISLDAAKYPSFFISSGDQDDKQARLCNEQFVLNTAKLRIPVQLDYRHAPHAYQPREFMDCYKAVVQFILTNY